MARSWDWLLFAVTCALAVLGTVLVWAATEPALRQAGLDPHTYLKKAILWAVLGFVLMMATACMDYRRIRRWTPDIYGLSLLLLLAVLAVGQSVNGAKAWISLPGGFQVEPSEFAKLGLILSAAWLLSRRNDPSGRPRLRDAGLAALAAAPLIILVEREPALGVMLVLVFTLAGMVVRLRHPALLGARPARGGGRRHLRDRQAAPAQGVPADPADLVPAPRPGPGRDRLQRPPGQDRGRLRRPARRGPVPRHVHRRQLRPLGARPTSSSPSRARNSASSARPSSSRLLGIVVFRAIRAAQIADDMFGMLVASGVAIWFIFQTFVNVGMTIGIMPITGLPLPFISYGGSAIFADMIAIGLVQSVRRHHKLFT